MTDPETPTPADELLEAWQTNQRIHLILLEAVSDEGLRSTLSKHGGRDVAGQFAHVHNVRVWHLEKRAKDLAEGLEVFPPKTHPSRRELIDALEASGQAIGVFLTDVLVGVPRRRGFRKGIFTSLSYLVAHESHHRGSILLTLKTAGHAVDRKVAYRIWGWDQI